MKQIAIFITTIAVTLMFASYVKAAPTSSSTGANQTIDRYIFAIGANNGGSKQVRLRYAESDAESFVKVMQEMGGVKKDNTTILRAPTIASLNFEFNKLNKKISEKKGTTGRQEVLVYYSGHADDKGLLFEKDLLTWKDFRAQINSISADVKIAVIDACGSGTITRMKGGVSVPAFMVDESSDMKGYAFITSSTGDEVSQESDKLKGSFFTHSLVSGLRGAGDISGDGKVTLSEAYQFAFNETLHKTETTLGGAQHPSRDMNLAGTGDVVMTDLRSTNAGMELSDDIDGRLFIRDSNGELVAELSKKSGRAMSLGLPAGKYTIRLERPAEYKETSITLSNGKREQISASRFTQVAAEKTVSRGELGGERSCANGDSVMCSLDSLDHHGKSRTTVNAVDKEDNPRKGLQIGVFASIANDYMLGSQISLFANVAQKEIHGLQASGIINVSKEHLEGAQILSLINIAGSFDGLQFAAINISKEKSQGVQIGNLNIAGDSVSTLQLGILNIAGYTFTQVGIMNITEAAGVQVSTMNISGSVEDVSVGVMSISGSNSSQDIGIMNIVGKSTGRQWGIVNICGECENTPIGLINFVGNGVWSATGTFNEMGGTGIKLDLGTAYFYTSLETSRNFEKGKLFDRYSDVWENGLGLGTHFGSYGSHFDLEYMFLNVTDKYRGNYGSADTKHHPAYHHRMRLGSTYKLLPGVGLTGGASLNMASKGYAEKNPLKPLNEYHDDFGSDKMDARFWPGFYAGLTLGRF